MHACMVLACRTFYKAHCQWNLSKTAICGSVVTGRYREVAALQRLAVNFTCYIRYVACKLTFVQVHWYSLVSTILYSMGRATKTFGNDSCSAPSYLSFNQSRSFLYIVTNDIEEGWVARQAIFLALGSHQPMKRFIGWCEPRIATNGFFAVNFVCMAYSIATVHIVGPLGPCGHCLKESSGELSIRDSYLETKHSQVCFFRTWNTLPGYHCHNKEVNQF